MDNVKVLLEHGASPHNTNSRNEAPLLIGKNTVLNYRGEIPCIITMPHPQISSREVSKDQMNVISAKIMLAEQLHFWDFNWVIVYTQTVLRS